MKTLILTLFLVVVSAFNTNAAFLVSDPQSAAIGMQYEIWSNVKGLPEEMIAVSGKLVVSANNEADGSIRYDLKDIGPGDYNWYVRYSQNWGYYGVDKTEAGGKSYSIFVPFEFTKRKPVQGPIKGHRLSP